MTLGEMLDQINRTLDWDAHGHRPWVKVERHRFRWRLVQRAEFIRDDKVLFASWRKSRVLAMAKLFG